jgi:hypothetical protein
MNLFCIRRAFLSLVVIGISAVPSLANPVTVPNPVPLLNPLVPSAAIPGGAGFTLTVTGTGFVSGSVVTWNGGALATTYVSNCKLTAAVPASDIATPNTASIAVVSPAPGGGTSNVEYLVIENTVPQNYWSSTSITGNNNLTSPVIGADFNNDGKLDLIVASGPTVYVLLGVGNGTFASAQGSSGPANSVITGVHTADINADGKQDLIINGKIGTAGFVATMLGNGDGTFQAPVTTNYSGIASSSIVVADFNADGILDVALVSSGSVQTLLGAANGSFAAGPVTLLTYVGRDGIAAADFNGDGVLDLVITAFDPSSQGYNFVAVLPGVGDGSFGNMQQVAGSGNSFVGSITAAVADFNGDGKLDIATAIQTAGATIQGFIYLSLGNGDGTFSVGTSVPNVASVTSPLLVGDFNADGIPDLATGGYFYYGQGDGSFPTFNGSSGAPTFVFAGDANGDGLLDVIDETITIQSSRQGITTLSAIGAELQVPPLPDFKGVVAPVGSTLVPGGTVSFNVMIEPLYGFTGDVTLGASNLPNGISINYNPATVPHANGSSTITLTASPSLPLGTYTFNLTGNSGSLTHSTQVSVNVNSSVGDFGGTLTQDTHNIAEGSTADYSLTIVPTGGFTGTVALSVSGLPPGATAQFSQNPVTGGSGTSTLTITTTSSTPDPQIYTPTITATSGTLTHSRSINLGVAPIAESVSGTVTPSQTVSASAGGIASYSLNLTTQNNSSQADLSLAVSGVPAGTSASFTPSTINTGTGTSTLNVVVPPGTLAPGSYTLLLTFTGSGVIDQISVVLTVNP